MHKRLVRFGSQWALVGVLFFYTVGTTMIVRHMERIVTPASASGSECATIPEIPDLPEPLVKVRTKIRCVEAILKNAVIEPYHNNGQIEGLRITGLDRILAARDLLLKNGDIIRAVNGHPLSSKRQAYEIFKRARTEPYMIVDLLQDGEAKKLLFDFR